jgi:hypothetical protein
VPVTVTWRADRVIRRAQVGELELETTTVCPPDATAVVVELRVTNHGGAERPLRIGLSLTSAVTRPEQAWLQPVAPSADNRLDVDRGRGAVVGRPSNAGAACVQGFDRPATRIELPLVDSAPDRAEWLEHRLRAPALIEVEATVGAGETWRAGFVQSLGDTDAGALAQFDRLAADVRGALAASEARWAGEVAGMFTPGSATAGALPVLETDNAALRQLYWMGAFGVLWFRRDTPHSVLGRTYDTIMPRYWHATTFIWDYSLSSIVHALLDPETMRRHLEHWIATDIHTHFGTSWLSGGPVGYWYSVNDFAMTRLVRDYVRFTGDRGWLEREIATAAGGSRTVAAHVREWATAWKGLRGAHALADYGGIDNLLECVSTYVHEVASLNATNVWCLRVAAELHDDAGLRDEARALVDEVQRLYADGRGYWHARQPDGRMVEVRHCYDFNTVAFALARDLPERQRAEMVDFFARELQTPSWMRALSAEDGDAAFSLRPDHQWNGAYCAWPADAAHALIRLGRPDAAAAWLPGLAGSAAQGPFSQGHFADGAKAPAYDPYILDWACSSSGAFADLVIQGFFGVDVPLDGSAPRATPQLADADPGARLRNLVVAGRAYDVTADGLAPSAD